MASTVCCLSIVLLHFQNIRASQMVWVDNMSVLLSFFIFSFYYSAVLLQTLIAALDMPQNWYCTIWRKLRPYDILHQNVSNHNVNLITECLFFFFFYARPSRVREWNYRTLRIQRCTKLHFPLFSVKSASSQCQNPIKRMLWRTYVGYFVTNLSSV